MVRRVLLVVLMIVPFSVFGTLSAFADSDMAARVVRLDEGCRWNAGPLQAEGSVHVVETQNGTWKISCVGDIVEGPSLDRAVQFRSTPDAPLGECTTPFGSTTKWHMLYAPSGESSFVCSGDLTP